MLHEIILRFFTCEGCPVSELSMIAVDEPASGAYQHTGHRPAAVVESADSTKPAVVVRSCTRQREASQLVVAWLRHRQERQHHRQRRHHSRHLMARER